VSDHIKRGQPTDEELNSNIALFGAYVESPLNVCGKRILYQFLGPRAMRSLE